MRPPKYRIQLTDKEKSVLEQLIRQHTTPQNLARRARVILLANQEGKTNKEIAQMLSTNSPTVSKWRKRWIERLSDPIKVRLTDAPRSGKPETITTQQWCQIMALACELPEDHGRPITHWTYRELADETIKQGIVEQLSTSHLCNFLKKQNFSRTEVATG